MEIHLEEIQNEGLLVSWTFKDRPDLNLSVLPRFQPHEVSEQGEAGLEQRKGRRGGNCADSKKAAAKERIWQLTVVALLWQGRGFFHPGINASSAMLRVHPKES